jgi:LuxR family maltose regulon positive regulatory protein
MRDLHGADEHLRFAEGALETGTNADPSRGGESIQSMIDAGRAVISVMQGDALRAMSQAEAALAGLDNRNVRARSIASIALGLACLSQGAARTAAQAFGDVAIANRATSFALFMVLAAVGEACAHRMAGALDLAQVTYDQAVRWSAEHSHASLLAGSLYTGLADILRERNELEAALECATQGITLERALGAEEAERWIEWHICNLLILARIKQAQGDLEGALTLVREAQEQLAGLDAVSFCAILAAFEAQLHLAQGDLAAAVRWLRRTQAHEPPTSFGLTPQYFVYAAEHLTIAPIQVLIAQGRASCDPTPVRRALALLDQLQDKTVGRDEGDLSWLRVKSLALRALAYQTLGEMAPAREAIERALALAEPEGYVRIFVDEGPAMDELLRQMGIRRDQYSQNAHQEPPPQAGSP